MQLLGVQQQPIQYYFNFKATLIISPVVGSTTANTPTTWACAPVTASAIGTALTAGARC
jgi:hypothetical protein